MAKTRATSQFMNQLITGSLILLYLCIGFVPNWGAVDKIAPQWLTLSILNLISLSVILVKPRFFSQKISKIIRTGIAILYISFFCWASLSYFYAINPTEVLVNLARQANTLFMYLNLTLFLYGFKNKMEWLSWAIVMILGFEIYAILTEAYAMGQTPSGVVPGQLKGVTANRNIAAFSLAIKIPFALFLLHTAKKNLIKITLGILLFATLFGLSMISSRASYLAVLLISILYLGYLGYHYFKDRQGRILLSAGNILVPLLLAIALNQTLFSNAKTASALERASTISVSTNDGSVNQRLRYYEDVLTHIIANPIIGTGLGNWKLVSIDYDKEDIKGYVVPYHAHSDFIQLGAELGFIGFFLYLGIFFFAGYAVIRVLLSSRVSNKEKTFVFFLLMALGVYTIDANLNFPSARPQVLAPWAIIMGLISFYYIKTKEPSEAKPIVKTPQIPAYALGLIGIALFVPSLSITNTVYKSLQAQMTILQDFNSNQYNIPLSQIENFVPTVPNITVTTIPMDAIKARYYFHYKKYDDAISHLKESTSQNPYLMYSELLFSQVYLAKGDLKRSIEYAEKAFYNLPNNNLHAAHYIQLLIETGNKEGLSRTFALLTKNNEINNWKNYLVAVTKTFPPGDPLQVERALQATKIFSGNNEFMQLYKAIALGTDRIREGLDYSNEALSYFNQGKHELAVQAFEKAIASDPLEYSYRENVATSYYLINDLENALKQIDVVINELNPLNGKCEYIKALVYLKYGDPIGACPLLQTSKDSGYSQAEGTFQQYCANI